MHRIVQVVSSYDIRPDYWKDIAEDTWRDCRWQIKNALYRIEDIECVFDLTPGEKKAVIAAQSDFPVKITPHYVALALKSESVRRQCIPLPEEYEGNEDFAFDDPLGEDAHCLADGLTCRYPDRALIYTTHQCPVHCRHCTRRRQSGKLKDNLSVNRIFDNIEKLKSYPQISDVLLSGGDVLSHDNRQLRKMIQALREMPHIDIIRICTRFPVTLPQRIDEELCDIFREFAPIYLNTHFNSPDEATAESENALRVLVRCGCIVSNQSVLLKNINDSAAQIEALNRWLLKNGCRPYYLFQVDVGKHISHFRTPLACGPRIIASLRGRVSGLAIPHFAVDLPGGCGKVELCENPVVERDGKRLLFKNHNGEIIEYFDL